MRRLLLNTRGVTLIELLVVVGMIAILSSIAAPGLIRQSINYKLKATARDIYSTFQQAKLEAAKENEMVVLIFSPDTYSPGGRKGAYQLFLDNGAGGGTVGNLVQDGSERSLAIVAMPKNVSLISASFSDGTVTTDRVGFTGQGLPFGSYAGSVQIRNSTRWYRINLSVAGNIRTEISADGINWS